MNRLKLVKAAIVEMVRTRIIKVLFKAVVVDFGVTGAFVLLGYSYYDSVSIGTGLALGVIVGQAEREASAIYDRLKKKQKLDALNNR